MKRDKLNNVIDFRQVINEKKYYLLVSDSECVMECWANSHIDLLGIIYICDEEENLHKVSMIVDVLGRHIYQIGE